eukprot:SAG31_NODE_46770_length_253_cov_0.662338_1_plen_47_part_01
MAEGARLQDVAIDVFQSLTVTSILLMQDECAGWTPLHHACSTNRKKL